MKKISYKRFAALVSTALTILMVAVSAFAQDTSELYKEAAKLFGEGKYNESIVIYQKCLTLQPNEPAALLSIGEAYYHLNQFDKAIEFYQKSVSAKSDYTQAWESMADVLFKQEKYSKAAKAYEQTVKLNPTAANYFNLGNSYYNDKQYAKATAAYQETMRLEPNYPKAKEYLADAETAEKEKKEKRRALWSGIVGAVTEAVSKDDDKSQNSQTQTGGGGGARNAAPADLGGAKVQGTYTFSNGYNVFKKFVFNSDGTFQRNGAVSGVTTTGEYTGNSEDTGKYSINGGTLTLYTDNGKTETHSIIVRGDGASPLYLVIDGQTFTNRD